MIQFDERDYQAMKNGPHAETGTISGPGVADHMTKQLQAVIGHDVMFTIGGLILLDPGEEGRVASVGFYHAGVLEIGVNWKEYTRKEEEIAFSALRAEQDSHLMVETQRAIRGQPKLKPYAALIEFNMYGTTDPWTRLHAKAMRLSSTKTCVVCYPERAKVEKFDAGTLAPYLPGFQYGGDLTEMSDGFREVTMSRVVQQFETKLRSMN